MESQERIRIREGFSHRNRRGFFHHRKRPRRWLSSSKTTTTTTVVVGLICLFLTSWCIPSSVAAVTEATSHSVDTNTTSEESFLTKTSTFSTSNTDNKKSKKEASSGENSKQPKLPKKSPWDSDSRGKRIEDELQKHARELEGQQKDKEISLNQQQQQKHKDFMDWCHNVLGVQTSLEVHTFFYYDYMTALTTHPMNNFLDDDDDDDDDFEIETDTSFSETQQDEEWEDPPLIAVRGLRATRDISEGEIVISIPFQALLTVSTTIDQDPVLSRVMGPKARNAYGWTLGQDEAINTDGMNEPPAVDFFELPLLAMALLHHRKLGTSSPLFPYISILQSSPIDSMPFLWNKQQRREFHSHQSRISQGVETVARSIRQEMKEMYHTVVDTLVTNHPDLFGKDATSHSQYDILEDGEWPFSFEKFQWAFAMVNSRHWLLPIADLERRHSAREAKPPSPLIHQQQQPQGSVDGVPPAEMPTDAWLEQVRDEDDSDDDTGKGSEYHQRGYQEGSGGVASTSSYHSFLAPVADLLNFGPPCTRGRYNHTTHTFDIVASCNFTPGQEVTFWYSDECEDIIIGNYGFTHPMVPKCPTAEEYRQKLNKWKHLATSLQEELADAYEDMDVIDVELQNVQQILADCDCCQTESVPAAYWVQHRQISDQQAKPIQKQQQQQQQQSEGVDHGEGFHANYLRNPQEKVSRQIRGGTMTSGSGRGKSGSVRERSSTRSTKAMGGGRSSRGTSSDDEVEHHGVRRMWAGRSAL